MHNAIAFVMCAVGIAGCGFCIDSYLATGEDHAGLFCLFLVAAALAFGELREAFGRKVGETE